MKTGTRVRAVFAVALVCVLAPATARAACNGMTCWSCSTPSVTLAVNPGSPTAGSVASVSCSTSGGTVTGLAVTVGGGTLPNGTTTQSVTGNTASLSWTTPAAGTYPVTCLVTTGTCTSDPSPNPAAISVVVAPAAAPAPVIDSVQGPASPAVVGNSYAFTAAAHDPQGRPISYQWSASLGTIAGAGATASWTAPAAPGNAVVTVRVTNDLGGVAAQDYLIAVVTAVYQGPVSAGVPKPRRLASVPAGGLFAVDGYGALWMLTPSGDSMGMVSLPERATAVAASASEVFVGTESGDVLVLDPSNGSVKRQLSVGYSSGAVGLAFEPSRGVLWMAMRGAGQLIAMRLDGSFAAVVSLPGVSDVAVDRAGGLVWAMQETNPAGGLAAAYTLDGVYVRSIVTVGGGAGQVYRANGIAADSSGRVYVADPFAGQVTVVSGTGAFVEALGFAGAGQLTRPAGMTFLANGDLLVTDTDQGRLQRFGSGAPLPACQVAGMPDSDCDGLPDWWEDKYGLNKYWAGDALLDLDGDGLTNLQEFALGTNPRNADTDGDGYTDGEEVASGFNPLDPNDHRPSLVASNPAPTGPGLARFGATVVSRVPCTVAWKQTAGPAVLLRQGSSASPSFVARAVGTYSFQGQAVCGRATSNQVAVDVVVENAAPWPDAGRVAVVPPGQWTVLDGSFSSDANGDALALQWDQMLGSPLAGATAGPVLPLHARPPGLYAFQLTATDPLGASGVAEVPLLVLAYGQAGPTAVALTPVVGEVGRSLVLDAGQSVPQGALAFAWTQVVAESAAAVTLAGADQPAASFVPGVPGTYVFTVSVMADGIRSPPARVEVYVAPAGGTLPRAAIAPAPAGIAGEPLALDGRGSVPGASGAGLQYRWRQVSGPAAGLTQADQPVATVVPFAAGTYGFELSVSDGASASVPARVIFDAEAAGTVRPTAVATAPASALVSAKVRLDGRRSQGARRFRWTQVAGPWVALDDATAAAPTFRPILPGSHAFELEVDDGAVRSAPVRVSVDVLPR